MLEIKINPKKDDIEKPFSWGDTSAYAVFIQLPDLETDGKLNDWFHAFHAALGETHEDNYETGFEIYFLSSEDAVAFKRRLLRNMKP